VAETYRVAVYYGDDEERKLATEAFAGAAPDAVREFRGVLEGPLAGEKLERLLEAGLTVDVIDTEGAVAVPPASGRLSLMAARAAQADPAPSALDELRERARGVVATADGFRERAPVLTAAAVAPAASAPADAVYRIRLASRITPDELGALGKLGVEVLAHEPHRWYRAQLPATAVDAVRALPFVEDMAEYGAAETATPALLQAVAAGGADASEPEAFDVTLHRAADLPSVRRMLAGTEGVQVVDAAARTIRFHAASSAPFLGALAELPQTATLTPVREATLLADHGRQLIGIDAFGNAPHREGDGEIVGIVDSGIDEAHPDLADRIASAESLNGQVTDTFGHGTHVAGIVAGTGAASAGAVRGVAPKAKLAVLKITGDDGKTALPPDLGPLLQRVVDKGARIVNLSLGVPAQQDMGGIYDHYSQTVDAFVLAHPDVLVVVAAGNEGDAPDGTWGLQTMGTPATAKNVLTVGSCATDRKNFDETWGQRAPAAFPLAPAKDARVAGDPDTPAGDSNRGPTHFDRVKPDVLAPGTYIRSARATTVDPRLPWEDDAEFGGKYVYVGGTSMAAPFASGAAAICREHLRQERGIASPSAALLKAILIASARRIPSVRPAGSAGDAGYPDFDQGYGRIDLSSILPHDGAPAGRRLELVDVANDSPDALESRPPEGSARLPVRTYVATVQAGAKEPLRVVLTWLDPAEDGVQNDLGLEVLTGGLRVAGNAEHTFGRNPALDRVDRFGVLWDDRNTVEQVVVAEPAAGDYRIRVVARNTLFPPQGYALVVCGELTGSLTVAA
jgi:serine protease AprX